MEPSFLFKEVLKTMQFLNFFYENKNVNLISKLLYLQKSINLK